MTKSGNLGHAQCLVGQIEGKIVIRFASKDTSLIGQILNVKVTSDLPLSIEGVGKNKQPPFLSTSKRAAAIMGQKPIVACSGLLLCVVKHLNLISRQGTVVAAEVVELAVVEAQISVFICGCTEITCIHVRCPF